MKRVMTGALVTALCLFGLTGCSDSNCGFYCERWQECREDDLDVEKCTNKCEEASRDNEDHADKAEECAQCLESRTCAEASERCFDDCFGVRGP